MRLLFALAIGLGLPTIAFAQCASDAEVAAFVGSFLKKTPAKALGSAGTIEDAYCTQGKVVAALEDHLGPVIGYKAGLTAKPAMERFGVSEPVRGVLYRDMMLENGAKVPAKFGAIPLFEADLILVVGSEEINKAKTPEDVLKHVSAVRPFIELPDLMFAKGEPITGATITAMGVGARLGILGDAIAVDDPAAMADALQSMTAMVKSANGETLSSAPGAAVLGHPANAVTWLVSTGLVLKPGDFVSVGSIGPLHPTAKAGGGATVTYAGLPGDPELSVVFEE